MRFRVLFTFGLTLPTALVATAAHAEEPVAPATAAAVSPAPTPPVADDLPPPGAKTTHIVAGVTTTAISYGLALASSFLLEPADFNGSKDLRIPIAGPWLALGKTGCPTSNSDCDTAPLVIGAILLVLDGVTQAGGLGIIGEGLFLNTSNSKAAPKKAEGPGQAARQQALAPIVRAVPLNFGKDGVGLGVVGTF